MRTPAGMSESKSYPRLGADANSPIERRPQGRPRRNRRKRRAPEPANPGGRYVWSIAGEHAKCIPGYTAGAQSRTLQAVPQRTNALRATEGKKTGRKAGRQGSAYAISKHG